MILALVLVITGVVLFVVLGVLACLGTVTGSLTLDIGSGRRLRPLGPRTWRHEPAIGRTGHRRPAYPVSAREFRPCT
jgi:hypothetical protein